MKYMLDTHTFIWWHENPTLLSAKVLSICEDFNNQLILSMVSIWEIQIKLQLNKLKLEHSLTEMVKIQRKNGIEILPIKFEHILRLDNLPLHHKDPFDRLLIAQANIEQLTLLTKDEKFKLYSQPIIW
jgi:PIN domain nuclease of toxin-antitoxin system